MSWKNPAAEGQATSLLQEADRLASSGGGGFFSKMLGADKSEKYERATAKYEEAAAKFLEADKGIEAGRAYERAAALYAKELDDSGSSGRCLIKAQAAYKNYSRADSKRVMEEAIRLLSSSPDGLYRAADYLEKLAQFLEEDIVENMGGYRAAPPEAVQEVIEAYKQSSKWRSNLEHSKASMQRCDIKVAELAAILGPNYKGTSDQGYPYTNGCNQAIDIFERYAIQGAQNRAGAYDVREFLFKAGLCHLATGDKVAIGNFLNKHGATLAQDRIKLGLIGGLFEALQADDREKWIAEEQQFRKMSGLVDGWKDAMLAEGLAHVAEEESFA